MGDKFTVKCKSDAIFYEYKDYQSRAEKKPTNIYADKNNAVSLPDKYKPIFEQLKALDGDAKTLSAEDLALGKNIIHEHGIKEVRVDGNNGISTFVFKDDTAISVDMKLNNQEQVERKLLLAKSYGYDKYYDIQQVEKDGKDYFKVIIKKTPFYFPDPKGQTIVIDFNLKTGVLLDNNRELLESRYNYTGSKGSSYNHAKIKDGDVIYLPVEEVSFDSSPCGFIGRSITAS